MKTEGIIFDLEDVLIFYQVDKEGENQLIFDFLMSRKYIFHSDDLEGKSPLDFARGISSWHNNDETILKEKVTKLLRDCLMQARGDSEVTGVLQVLAQKYQIVILAKSQGDGIVKALAGVGIRGFVNYIVAGERWFGQNPDDLGLTLAMEKFPEIAEEDWVYVGLPASSYRANGKKLRFLTYGIPPYSHLDDIMEELM